METDPWVGRSVSELLSYRVDLLSLVLLSKHSVVQELAVVFVIYLKIFNSWSFFRLLKNPVNANSQYCIKYVHLGVCFACIFVNNQNILKGTLQRKIW